VFRPPAAPAPARSFASSKQCAECHAEAYAEWESSWHALAWEDPEVRLLSNDFANTDCIDCHAPRPVFETGVGKRVLPRASRRAEGVDCISCHALPESEGGGVAGTIDAPGAACRPVARVELTRVELCASCHDQHGTVKQWRASRYAEQGIGCIDCHMPHRGGDPARGRVHTMHGGHDIELVKSAVALRARRVAGGVAVEVENVAAGHSFPTDERSRAADVFWRPLSDPAAPWRHLHRFRDPYRHEVGLASTLLPAHATQALSIADADASGPIEVALFYKTKPYWSDPERPDPEREASLLHSVRVE
jgi:hypothetical protein